MSSTTFVFFGPIRKLKIATSSTNFMLFVPVKKPRWPHRSPNGRDIFDFSFETARRNSTKLKKKEDLNVLYQVFVFRADWKTNMTALDSGWDFFLLLLINRWTEFYETWQETRSQRHIRRLCFSGPIGKPRWPSRPLIGWYIFDYFSS